MLRILGSRKTLCDGLTRRDMLWAGGHRACANLDPVGQADPVAKQTA